MTQEGKKWLKSPFKVGKSCGGGALEITVQECVEVPEGLDEVSVRGLFEDPLEVGVAHLGLSEEPGYLCPSEKPKS